MMVRLGAALLIISLFGCASTGFDGQCIEAATAACSIMKRNGYDTRIAIQKTPKSDRGIYHAQCQAYDGEWKWVILEVYPKALWGHREHGDVVEYR